MGILQRYVLKELAGPTILSVLFFSFLMMLRQLFSYAELLLEAGVGFDIFMEFVGIIAATLIIITVPMAALMGCLVGIGRLTSENEILAMRVGGVSLPKIFLPVFVISTLGSLGLMWCGFTLLPGLINHLADKRERIQFEILTNLEPGRLYDLETTGADVALFYEERAPAEHGDSPFTLRMSQVALRLEGEAEDLVGTDVAFERDDIVDPVTGTRIKQLSEALIFAQSGMIRGDLNTRGVELELDDGTIFPITVLEVRPKEGRSTYRRENPERETTITFESLAREMKPESDFDDLDRMDPRQMQFAELRAIANQEPEGQMVDRRGRMTEEWEAYLEVRNEMFQRLSLPWSLLAFVLIAVPLAVELRPRAKSFAFIVSLALITIYYVMITAAGAVGMANSPFTFAAYLSPNILIGGIGLFLFWRVQR